ncbi:Smr/MutS family protein [uncultured Sphingomonas sp.]|uniref:Smr/MutS family protein n=1 Tax=uncultured Sphingomonas sp. TaxID=158754 RepID=UPI0035CBCC6D
MAGRSLHPDELALWRRVMASVRPLRAVAPTAMQPVPPPAAPTPRIEPARVRPAARPVVLLSSAKVERPGVTLDGGWDRRLSKGAVAPDDTIDLHGHTLASAHALLDARLDQAVTRGDRIVLLVTGKPPRPESERPHARGAIRAAVADWLASSRHAGRVAAVRAAHPRHGGAGALYIILRRARG